jgi:hypothetical protein
VQEVIAQVNKGFINVTPVEYVVLQVETHEVESEVHVP